MGKMNRIYPKLPNGDVGRDCEVEEWCGEPAYTLSWSDTLINSPMMSKGLARYKRIVRYKCLNGHRFDKEKTVEKDMLSGLGRSKPSTERKTSKKARA